MITIRPIRCDRTSINPSFNETGDKHSWPSFLIVPSLVIRQGGGFRRKRRMETRAPKVIGALECGKNCSFFWAFFYTYLVKVLLPCLTTDIA